MMIRKARKARESPSLLARLFTQEMGGRDDRVPVRDTGRHFGRGKPRVSPPIRLMGSPRPGPERGRTR